MRKEEVRELVALADSLDKRGMRKEADMVDTIIFASSMSRARRIVELAIDIARNDFSKEWLRRDEKGMWEKRARKYLEETQERAAALNMSEESVDKEIAIELAYQAAMAMKPSAMANPIR